MGIFDKFFRTTEPQPFKPKFTNGYYLYRFLGRDNSVLAYREICKPQSWRYIDENYKLYKPTKLERALL